MNRTLYASIKALRAAVESETQTLLWRETQQHVAVLLDHVQQVPDSSLVLEAAHTAIAEDRLPDAIEHLRVVMNCLHAECSDHVIQLDGLLEAFDEALKLKPFLRLEIGFNRVSGWLITVYDKSGGVERVAVQTQGLRADDTCQWTTLHLQAFAKENSNV
ncbi:hypothetical protein [Pseudomonas sp. 18175]|uniref:hypothetical protein n=1 Tax=Pseudomonas sp. 18175 TaxID=3390056 RepID=UPI003D253B9D